jgi:hypothetical protein
MGDSGPDADPVRGIGADRRDCCGLSMVDGALYFGPISGPKPIVLMTNPVGTERTRAARAATERFSKRLMQSSLTATSWRAPAAVGLTQ